MAKMRASGWTSLWIVNAACRVTHWHPERRALSILSLPSLRQKQRMADMSGGKLEAAASRSVEDQHDRMSGAKLSKRWLDEGRKKR